MKRFHTLTPIKLIICEPTLIKSTTICGCVFVCYRNVKYYVTVDCTMQREVADELDQQTNPRFRSSTEIALNPFEIDVDSIALQISRQAEEFISHGSCWQFTDVTDCTLHVALYDSIGASSYIVTPKFLQKKRAIVNVQNKDNKCFMYSVLSGMHKEIKKNRERVKQYRKFEKELNMSGLTFPITLQQIPKFEAQNKTISIGVLSYSDIDRAIIPIYRSKYPDRFYKIHLLLLTHTDKQTDITSSHYTLIKSLNRLLHHKSSHRGKIYTCDNCCRICYTPAQYEKHRVDCLRNGECRLSMPSKKTKRELAEQKEKEKEKIDEGERDSTTIEEELMAEEVTSKEDREYIEKMTKTYTTDDPELDKPLNI